MDEISDPCFFNENIYECVFPFSTICIFIKQHLVPSDILFVTIWQWIFRCPLLHTWLTLIFAWISNCIDYKLRDEITFSNLNGGTLWSQVWECTSDFIAYFIGHMITYPSWNQRQSRLVQGACARGTFRTDLVNTMMADVSKYSKFNNRLLPQPITLSNAELLSIWPCGTTFSGM